VGGYGSETSSAIVPRRIGLRDNDPPGVGADGCSATQAFALASLGCGGYRNLKKRATSIRFRKPQHPSVVFHEGSASQGGPLGTLSATSFDDLVGTREQRLRHVKVASGATLSSFPVVSL